jgi:iron complex outermembrane receptor protein
MNKPILLVAILSLSTTVYAQNRDSVVQVEDVTVTATLTQTDIRTAPMNVHIINNKTIQNRLEPSLLPIITEETAGLFSTARGVMGYGVSGGSAGTISVRGIGGAPTTGVLVLIDGHPQFMGMMGHPLPDAYQGLSTERVEVALGPASALYGTNAMGGVINIITKKQTTNGAVFNLNTMYGSYNTSSLQMASSVRKDKVSTYLALERNSTDGHRNYMGFEQYMGYGKLTYDYNPHHRTFVDINITQFDAESPGIPVAAGAGNPNNGADAKVLRGVVSGVYENNYAKTSGAAKLFYNFGDHYVIDRNGNTGALVADQHFESNDYAWGANLYQSYRPLENTELSAKVDYTRYGGRAVTLKNSGDLATLHADTAVQEIAAYIGARQLLFDKRLSLSAGVRWNYNNFFGQSEWIPQAGITYSAADNTTLKAIVGKGFRNPTMRELFMNMPNPNPDLLPERIMNYELVWVQNLLDRRLNFTFSGYYLAGSNTIAMGMKDTKMTYVNSGSIENWGIELTSKYRINEMFSIAANYAYLNMKNPVLAAPEHKIFGSINFNRHKWSAAAGMQYIANIYTALATSTPTANNPNSPAVQTSFALLNARVTYRIRHWVSVFVKGENLLNQKYEINAGYPMPGATVYGGINLGIVSF